MENSAKKSKAEHASGPPRSPGERTLGRKASVPSMRREPLAQRVIPNGRNHPALLTPPFLSPSPLLTQSPQARIAVSSDEINYFSTLPDSPPRDPPSPRIQIFSEDAEEPSSEIIGGAFRSSMLSRDLDAYVFPSPAAMTTGSSSNSPDAHSPPSFTPSLLLSPPLVVPEPQQPQTSVRSKRRPPAIIAPAYNLEVDGQLPPGTTIPTPTPSPRLRRFYPLDPSTSPLPSPNPEQGSFPFLACPSPSFLSAGLPSPALSMSGHSPSENGSVSPRLLIAEPFSRLAAGLTKRTRRNSNDSTQCDLPLARSPSPSPSSPQLSAPELTRRPSFTSSNSEKEQEKAREASKRSQKVKGKHLRGFSWIDRPDETMRVKVGRWIGGWRGRAVRLIVLAVLGYMIFSTPPAAPAPVNIRRRQIHSAHGRLRRGDLGRSFIHPDVVDPHHRRSSPISFARFVAAPYHFAQKLLALPTSSYKALAGSRSARDAATARSKKNKSPATVVVPPPRTAPVDHNPLPAPLVHADSANRDTLVLYRILGNDLPPRHSPGQTLRNLRFLLQYESDFSTLPHVGPHPIHHSHVYGSGSHSNELHSAEGGLRVDKYFVLNRIADQEMLDAIRGLLRLYSVPESRILVIPFEWEEYQKREFNWDGGVDKLSCWGVGSGPTEPPAAGPGSFAMGKNSLLDQGWKVVDIAAEDAGTFDSTVAALRAKKKATLASLRALDYMYHEKNLYAMNNNGGRNFALEHGRSLKNARWILPLDGNSFLTPAAMDSIVRTLSISGEGPTATRYLVIPMARLLANEHVLANNSIALVPKHHHIEGGSATTDAELHHAPEAAPLAPEEPQVGFRFDATESYQPEMRYGRRSKLELLWRLGAIPYSRGLDRRTYPWESSDRRHVTESAWGSIAGVVGLTVDSPVHQPPPHQPHVGFEPWNESSPERGPPAFSKAGWVYRLFSGDKNQEEISPEAVTLRNTNRIKGIVAFLERLDEKVARGVGGCNETGGCGFTSDRLWSFDHLEMERLRQKHKAGLVSSVDKVDAFETVAMDVHVNVKKLVDNAARLSQSSAQRAATNASVLALAGYLTGNASYSTLATELINSKFIKPTPLFYRQGDQRAQMQRYQHKNANGAPVVDEEGVGYAFPPPPIESGLEHTWSSPTADAGPPLPFNPLNFDPTLLLDTFRILALPNSPQAAAHSISRKSINSIFVAQLSYLLHSPEAIALSRHPDSPDIGAHHDAKIAALAAFFDDAKLLGRIANRGRLRLPRRARSTGVMDGTEQAKEVHWRLIRGLAMVKLRPYNLVSNAVRSWSEPPFDILGL